MVRKKGDDPFWDDNMPSRDPDGNPNIKVGKYIHLPPKPVAVSVAEY